MLSLSIRYPVRQKNNKTFKSRFHRHLCGADVFLDQVAIEKYWAVKQSLYPLMNSMNKGLI